MSKSEQQQQKGPVSLKKGGVKQEKTPSSTPCYPQSGQPGPGQRPDYERFPQSPPHEVMQTLYKAPKRVLSEFSTRFSNKIGISDRNTAL